MNLGIPFRLPFSPIGKTEEMELWDPPAPFFLEVGMFFPFLPPVSGGHVEYRLKLCHCSGLSWCFWRRFSDFLQAHEDRPPAAGSGRVGRLAPCGWSEIGKLQNGTLAHGSKD